MRRKESIKKNYIYNLSYQILQILTVSITVPYVSRILSADGIGVYSFTASVASYFLLFGQLGISLYGQREIAYNRNNVHEKVRTVKELFLFRLVTMGIAMTAFLCFIHFQKEHSTVYIIQTISFLSAVVDFSWFYQGEENFKFIALRNMAMRTVSIACIFILIRNENDLTKYIFINALCGLFANISIAPFVIRMIRNEHMKLSELKPFRHFSTIVLLFIPQIAVQVYTVLDKTMIGVITKSPYENGCYELSYKIIQIVLIIVTSLGTVVVPRISSLNSEQKNEEIKDCLVSSYKFVLLLGLPMMLGLQIVSPRFVSVFFGDSFGGASLILQILSGLILAIGFNNVLGIQYLIPCKKENVFTFSVTCGAVANFIMNMALIPKYKAVGAAIASVAAESLVAVIQFIYARRMIHIFRILATCWKIILSSFVMFVSVFFISRCMSYSMLSFTLIIVIGVAVYSAAILLLREEFVFSRISQIKEKFYK